MRFVKITFLLLILTILVIGSVFAQPPVPTLSGPVDGSVGMPTNLMLNWNPSAGAGKYWIQVSSTNTFSSMVFDDSNFAGTSVNVGGLANSTLYYWRVCARDSVGFSAWTPFWSFTTVAAGSPPLSPTLLNPVDGSPTMPINLSLNWNPSAGANKYWVQVSTNNTFSAIIFNDSSFGGTSAGVSGLANSTTYYWRVSAINGFGISGWSPFWSFTTVSAGSPPTPPTLSTPVDGSPNMPLNVSVNWNASAGANKYRVQVSSNNVFTAIIFDDSSFTGTSAGISGLANNMTYYWRVSAINAFGMSGWSPFWSFSTVAGGTPPVIPILNNPPDASTNMPLNFNISWNPSAGAGKYWVQVSSNNTFTAIIYEDSSIIGTSAAIGGLANNMTYYWRVGAINIYGFSGFSPFRSFTTIGGGSPPAVPVLSGPASGSTNLPTNVNLNWILSGGATKYWVQVSSNNTFTAIIFDDSTITNATVAVGGLVNNTTYYWRVNAINAFGMSGWSPFWNFTTLAAGGPPVSPTLIAPGDGSPGMPTNLTLTWNPSAGAGKYWVQVSTTNTFTARIFEDSSVSASSVNIGGLANNSTYYWRVSAMNAFGISAWSTTWSFTTGSGGTPPTMPVLNTPADGSGGLPINPVLSWNASAGANNYRLQVSTTNTFTAIVFEDSTITNTTYTVPALLTNTIYYWRVMAKNSFGVSPWSTTWSFVTAGGGTPPLAPVLSNPVDVSTNMPTNLILNWNTSAGATKYWVQVSATNTFATRIFEDSSLVTMSVNVGGLAMNTTYYWRVSAINAFGISNWSTIWSFTTGSGGTPPPSPVLSSPADETAGTPTSPVLIWNTSAGANNYRLQVSTTNTFTAIVFEDSAIINTTFTVPGLLANTKYYWRVSAKNSFGVSPWSTIWSFQTAGGNLPPIAPILNNPVNASTNMPTNLILNWNTSAGATKYWVQVSTTNTFTTRIFEDSSIVTMSVNVGGLSNNATYYWRVSAINSLGISAWSTVWSFTTGSGATPPIMPVLSAPANGSVGLPTSPILSWNASVGATNYRLQVSTTNTFTAIVFEDSSITNTSFTVPGLFGNMTYYWRVSAKNAIGVSPWSVTWSFVTAGVTGDVKISGYIRDSISNSGIANVTMTLSGDAANIKSTDSIGYYEFIVLKNKNYTVTPSKAGFAFNPAFRSFTNITSDLINQNFLSGTSFNSYKVSGFVRDSVSNKGIGGVNVSVSGDGTFQRITDTSGYFEFMLMGGKNYTITPAMPSMTFMPAFIQINNLNSNKTDANFIAKPFIINYKIGGYVIDSATGTGVGGVNILISGDGNFQKLTDSTGYYEFMLPGGKNYTVTPAKANMTFLPLFSQINNLNANRTDVSFLAKPIGGGLSYKVGGFVRDSVTNKGIGGVNVMVTGDGNFQKVTDTNGYYEFMLLGGKNYTITPVMSNMTFIPLFAQINNLNGNRTDVNFLAKPIGGGLSYKVSGFVRDSATNKGIGGVNLTISGDGTFQRVTDTTGYYEFMLMGGKNYTITPAMSNMTFMPFFAQINNLNSNMINVNFLAKPIGGGLSYKVSGFVRDSMTNKGIGSVNVMVAGDANFQKMTDTTGYYEFMLLGGKNYTITPVMMNMTFKPFFAQINNLNSNMMDVNFLAKPIEGGVSYKVSGFVRDSMTNKGIGGVNVMVAGDANFQKMTDTTGYYEFMLLGGKNYTITPVMMNMTFKPLFAQINNLNSNMMDVNFLAKPIEGGLSYKVSGFVRDSASNKGIGGVNMTVSGDGTFQRITDTTGYYEYMLIDGKNYTITPAMANMTFMPVFVQINNLNGNRTDVNFLAKPIGGGLSYKVSGFVRDSASNKGVGGVNMTVSGDGTFQRVTDTTGYFEFMLMGGKNYTIKPAMSNMTFIPLSAQINNLNGNRTDVNFLAKPIGGGLSYKVSGFVRDSASNKGVGGVNVMVAGDANFQKMTDTTGYYEFMLMGGKNYTIKPAMSNMTFIPLFAQINNLNSNMTDINFLAKPFSGGDSYKVSGFVRDSVSNKGVGGVNVMVAGDANFQKMTDTTGYYEFMLMGGKNYTIKPAMSNMTFIPLFAQINNLNSNMTDINFLAKPFSGGDSYKVSGFVRDSASNKGIGGVNVMVAGDANFQKMTDTTGYYEFMLLGGKNYTITPAMSSMTFMPLFAQINNLNGNRTDVNFLSKPIGGGISYKVSGFVRDSVTNKGVGGVNVLVSGDANFQKMTDTTGYFEFILLGGKKYMIVPNMANMIFNPPSVQLNNLSGDKLNIIFQSKTIGSGKSYVVSGYVRDSITKKGIAGITINITGDAYFNRITDTNGFYDVMLLGGKKYALIPTHPDFSFSPVKAVIEFLSSDRPNTDFNAKLAGVSIKISGFVKDSVKNKGIGGVKMLISGDANLTKNTDTTGYYEFFVMSSRNYMVTASHPDFVFTPPSIMFNNLNSEKQNQNFVAKPIGGASYRISGFVKDSISNKGISGVTVNISGDAYFSRVTDSTGFYDVVLLGGKNYMLAPQHPDFSFNPKILSFVGLSGDIPNANFIAKPMSISYRISGFIKDSVLNKGMGGIQVYLSGDANISQNTDSLGYYEFVIKSGKNYTITPKMQNLIFSPASITFNSINSDKFNTNFLFRPLFISYRISGYVLDSLKGPVDSVTMILSGDLSMNQRTNQNGYYEFFVAPGKNYMVTPSKSGYKFDPPTRAYTPLNSEQQNQNYKASIPVYVPAPPQLIAPSLHAGNLPTTVKLEWNFNNLPLKYRLQISSDSIFGSVILDEPGLVMNNFVTGYLKDGFRYYWRVQSEYMGAKSAWSKVYDFATNIIVFQPPKHISPADNSVNQPVNTVFVWQYDSNATSYKLQVSADSQFSSTFINDSNITGNFKESKPLLNGIKYFWRVAAQKGEVKSPWSFPWKLTTVPLALSMPVLKAPGDNFDNQPASVNLEWNPVQNASEYKILVSMDSMFLTPVIVTSTQSNSKIIGPLVNNIKYFWKVMASNPTGMSPWSAVWKFKTGNPAPLAPVLLMPVNNSADLPTVVDLNWSTDNSISTYHLQVSKNSEFTQIFFEDSMLTQNSNKLLNLSNGMKYFWRVRTKNSFGTSNWSYIFKFSTKFAAPPPPTLVSPVNGSPDLNDKITLVWNPIIGVKSYYIQVSSDSIFSNLVFNDSIIKTSSVQVGPLLLGVKYYWRARAIFDMDKTDWSAKWAFSTITPTLQPPALLTPGNNSVNQPISSLLSWSTIQNATSYKVQVSLDSTFKGIQFDSTVNTPSVQLGQLISGVKYFWRVKAQNTGGSSDWSVNWIFTTIVGEPYSPVLLAPMNLTNNLPTNAVLKWEKVYNAAFYEIQISNDSLFANIFIDDPTVQDVYKEVKNLNQNSEYFWRVRAGNISGISPWSKAWRFKTILSAPPIVVLMSPSDGANNISVNPSPVLVWNPSSTAKNYWLQVARDPQFTQIVMDKFNLSSTQSTIDNFSFNTKYYWRVKGFNDGGESDWSQAWSLTTVGGLPPAPILMLPSFNAVGIDTSTTLKWTSNGEVMGYLLEVSVDSLFGSTIVYDPSTTNTSKLLTNLSYATTYHWRVRSKNYFGQSEWIYSKFSTIAAQSEQQTWSQPPVMEYKTGKINCMAYDQFGMIYAGADSGVFKSSDKGLTWLPYGQNWNDVRYVSSLVINSGGDLFVAVPGGIFRILRSEFNWKKVYYVNAQISLSIKDGNILGSSNQSLIRSTDNGDNWTLLQNLPITSQCQYISVVYAAASGNIYIGTTRTPSVCIDGVTEIYYSNDNGVHWTSTGFNNKDAALGIATLSTMPTGELIAGTIGVESNPGALYKYSNGIWERLALTGTKVTALAVTATGEIYAAVISESSTGLLFSQRGKYNILKNINIDKNSNGVNHSKDGGKTWEQANEGLTDTKVTSITITDAGKIYIGTPDGGIYEGSYSTQNVAPSFTSQIHDTTISRNQQLVLTISANDLNNDKLQFSISGNPLGSTFDALSGNTYVFRWTPSSTQSGTFPKITFTVSDGTLTETLPLTINVSSGNTQPVFTSLVSDTSIKENQILSFVIGSSDPDNDQLTFRTEHFPVNARLDYLTPGSRVFTWRPEYGEIGVYRDLEIYVSDGLLSSKMKFDITVKKNNRAPSQFVLSTPASNEQINIVYPETGIQFKWNSSSDQDANDVVAYRLYISGPSLDTAIYGLLYPEVTLNIMRKLKAGSTYKWFVIASDGTDSTSSDILTFKTASVVTGIPGGGIIPESYALSQNYPNPFNPITNIQFSLPVSAFVNIEVYNSLGQRVRTILVNENYQPGTYQVTWDGRNEVGGQVSSGVYFYRLRTKEFMQTKKMLLIK